MPLLCETRLLEDLIVEMKNPNKKWECVGFAALTQFALGVTVAGLRNTSVTAFPRGNILLFFSYLLQYCNVSIRSNFIQTNLGILDKSLKEMNFLKFSNLVGLRLVSHMF